MHGVSAFDLDDFGVTFQIKLPLTYDVTRLAARARNVPMFKWLIAFIAQNQNTQSYVRNFPNVCHTT